jgi:hypothetical protein
MNSSQYEDRVLPLKWNHTHSTQHLVFFVVKYVVDLHMEMGIDMEKVASNCLRVTDALLSNKITNNDINFSHKGIISINKLSIDEGGYISFKPS